MCGSLRGKAAGLRHGERSTLIHRVFYGKVRELGYSWARAVRQHAAADNA